MLHLIKLEKFKIAVPPTNLKSIKQSKSYTFTEISSLAESLDKLYTSSFYQKKFHITEMFLY